MIDTRTTSILQRLPVILAVTAASYGLAMQHRDERVLQGSDTHQAAAQQARASQGEGAQAA